MTGEKGGGLGSNNRKNGNKRCGRQLRAVVIT